MSNVKLNVQQLPKSRGYLACWKARPGHVLLQLDFAAVEPTILAEVSGCPNYRKLYGPEANPNQDVYLHIGSKFRVFKDQVLKWYDPVNPTAESTALAKKELKSLRGKVIKEAHLGMQYGAGAGTVHAGLTRKEIDISFEDVQEMHNDYWSPDLFAVVKEYQQKLQREWRRNRGWILNPLGRPMAVSDDKYKDLLNTSIQSAGHDCLQRVIRYTDENRGRNKIPMYPWIVDFHDEMIWECEEEAAEDGMHAMRWAMNQLNADLQWSIKIKGDPTVHHNLSTIKCED